MGRVFLGVSPGGRKVAVKLIHQEHGGTAEFRERFAREIEAAQRVGGFHTAPVVDADPHADPPWMITAYIEGPSLQQAVGQDGPLPPGRVRALGAGLAEGLGAIHACGLVHRDLKPANVILADDGPRIIDFGVARAVDATTGFTTVPTTGDTVVGTVAYMAPEQIRGEAAGPASDVFALGSVLAFAATGRPPFGGDSPAAIMFRIINQPPDLAGLADEGLARLIAGCLAKSPADRLAVPAVLAALSIPAPPGLAPRAQRSGHRSRGRSRRRLAALVVTVAAAAALGAAVPVMLTRGAPETPNPGATSGAPEPDATGAVPVHDLTLHTHFGALFGNVAFSPDGRLLAIADGDGNIYVRVTSQFMS
jgi:serine/threonine protein kinase